VVNLRVDRVRLPGRRETTREVVEHRGAVVMLAVDEAGRVAFVSQYRYAAGQELLELPAGTLEEGEDPDAAAARELAEEIRFAPDRLEKLGEFFSAPGFCTERLHLYLATSLRPAEAEADEDERIEVVWAAPEEAAEWAREGRIRDAKTLAGLHLLALRSGAMMDAARYSAVVPYLVLGLLERHPRVWARLRDYAAQAEGHHKPRRSNLNRLAQRSPRRPMGRHPTRQMIVFLVRNASKQLKLGSEADPNDRRLQEAARVMDLVQMELRTKRAREAVGEAESLFTADFLKELERLLWLPTRGDLPAPEGLLRRPYEREPAQERLFDLT
jgi:ADP-ribose pyrophosphatase